MIRVRPRLLVPITVTLLLATAAPIQAQGWGLALEGGAAYTGWFTSDDDDNEEGVGHAIDYKANAAQSWSASVAITRGDLDVIGFDVVYPLGDVPDQEEIIEKTDEATIALQDYLVFFQLAGLIGPESTGLTRLLAGLRLDYRRFYFNGEAETVEDAVFATSDGTPLALDPGDVFQFETNFEDWYLTLLRIGSPRGALRLGVYKSVLEKPHETMEYAHGSLGSSLVVASRLEGRGAFMHGSTPTWDFMVRGGTVDFEPQGTVEQPVFGGEGSLALAIEMQCHPRLVLMGPPADRRFNEPRLSISPSFGFMFRADYLNPEDGEAGSADGELSMDIIAQAGVRGVLRF